MTNKNDLAVLAPWLRKMAADPSYRRAQLIAWARAVEAIINAPGVAQGRPFGWLLEGPMGYRQISKATDTVKPVLDLYKKMAIESPNKYKLTPLFASPTPPINAPGVAADKEKLVPHSLAGFLARHFSLHGEHASKQDIWDGGFRAARDLLAASPTPPSAAPARVGEHNGGDYDTRHKVAAPAIPDAAQQSSEAEWVDRAMNLVYDYAGEVADSRPTNAAKIARELRKHLSLRPGSEPAVVVVPNIEFSDGHTHNLIRLDDANEALAERGIAVRLEVGE